MVCITTSTGGGTNRKETIVPTKAGLLTAIAGKGVERGLAPEQSEDFVILRYEGPTSEREDNLHKQSIRSLVQRIAPDWLVHIASMGESGFSVEVRPKPGQADKPEPQEVVQEVDLTLDSISAELEELARKLKTLA